METVRGASGDIHWEQTMRAAGKTADMLISLMLALALTAVVIPGLGIYGLSVATVTIILVLRSRRFGQWLAGNPGYGPRLASLRHWHAATRWQLAGSIAFYLVPMSLLCTAVLLLTLRSPALFLAAALCGLVGITLLYLDLIAGLGLANAQPDIWPSDLAALQRFWSGHRGAVVLILLGILLPMCGIVLLAMQLWTPNALGLRFNFPSSFR
jgi:hypothetical protein